MFCCHPQSARSSSRSGSKRSGFLKLDLQAESNADVRAGAAQVSLQMLLSELEDHFPAVAETDCSESATPTRPMHSRTRQRKVLRRDNDSHDDHDTYELKRRWAALGIEVLEKAERG